MVKGEYPMHITIRSSIIQQDIAAIAELSTQLGYPTSIQTLFERLEKIHQDPRYHTLVVEHEHQVIGYAGLIEQMTWQFDQAILVIQAFVIHEKYRGKGIGKTLMNAIEVWAKKSNLYIMTLNSQHGSHRLIAHQFYQDLGFTKHSFGFKKVLD